MAGVFKSLDKSDVRITPFRAHKQWTEATTYTYDPIDGTITASFATIGSKAYDLKTSYGAQISGSNYYYCIAANGKGTGSVYLMDGNDNYTVLAQSDTSVLKSNLLAGLGWSQKEVVFQQFLPNGDYRLTRCEFDFATTSLYDTGGIPLPTRIDYIPDLKNSGYDYIIFTTSGSAASGNELYSFQYNGNTDLNAQGTLVNNSHEYGDYLGAVHISSSYFVAVNRKLDDNSVYSMYFNADFNNPIDVPFSASVGPFGISATTITPLRHFVYKNKGNLTNSPFFITFDNLPASEDKSRGLFIGYTLFDLSDLSTSQLKSTIQVNWDVINILTAKRYYRNASYSMNEPVHVVTRDGIIYLDVERTYTNSSADTVTYAKAVSVGQYLGYNGSVVAATINTDHDLFDPESPTLITLYTVSNLLQGKGPVTVVTYNVTDDTFSEPIHLGYKLFTSGSPFIGDNHTVAANFNGEYRLSTTVGLGYDLSLTNPKTGYKGNYIYTFDT